MVTEAIIGEQESNRASKGVKSSLRIKNSDAVEKILKIQRAFNNTLWLKAMRPLLDGGKGEHSVNINFQWESRRRTRRHVSKVE